MVCTWLPDTVRAPYGYSVGQMASEAEQRPLGSESPYLDKISPRIGYDALINAYGSFFSLDTRMLSAALNSSGKRSLIGRFPQFRPGSPR